MSHELSRDPILRDVGEVEGYKVLGPCVLASKIGQGGMGAVYRGQHVNLEIEVAVKCLLPALLTMDGNLITRFQREAQLAARVTHQNLVRVYDVGEQGDLHYLIMEYVTGESLRQRVERAGPCRPADAVTIIRQAAEGLAAAHEEEIVHRDIKPDNILISERGVVKVADLGLGRIGDGPRDLTMSRVPMGTPTYMPPEQWKAIGSVGPEGDVWALGATLYYLLAGESAFQGSSMHEVQRQICEGPFPHDRIADLPDGIGDVLCRSTQQRPENRYPSARELADALRDIATRHGFDGEIESVVEPSALDVSTAVMDSGGLPPRSVIERVKAEAAPSKGAATLRIPTGPTVALPSRRSRALVRGGVIAALALVGVAVYLATSHWIPGFRFEGVNPEGFNEYRHQASGVLMVLLPGGSFEMGSPDDGEAPEDEKPRHRVRLSPFLIAKHELSQKEWKKIMGEGNNPTMPQDQGDDLPVLNVSWFDCERFCRESGLSFPTEAQWEYACRAGSDTPFAFGDTLPEGRANIESDGPTAVDRFSPNEFGLVDLHGNAYEWCMDTYDESSYRKRKDAGGIVEDPVETKGKDRVLRGGSFLFGPDSARSARRRPDEPGFMDQSLGFRPAFNPGSA